MPPKKLQPLDLSILKHLVSKNLISTSIQTYQTLNNPAYLFDNKTDYDWFNSTFNFQRPTFHLRGNFFEENRDEEYYTFLLNDAFFCNENFFTDVFHYRPYNFVKLFIEKARVKHFDIIGSFRSLGYSQRAEENTKFFIADGYIHQYKLDSFPPGLWNGLARERNSYIDSICLSATEHGRHI